MGGFLTKYRRLSLGERGWAGEDVVRVLGPFAGVTADGLAGALLRLHADQPNHLAVSSLDHRNQRWIGMDRAAFTQRVGDLVLPVPADRLGGRVIEAISALDLGDRTLVLATDGQYVGVRASHAIGDGYTVSHVIAYLIGLAAGQQVQLAVGVRAPMLRAVTRFFGRDPRRVIATLRVERPDADLSRSVPTRPWKPEPAQYWARSARSVPDDLRAWRDTNAPGASTAAILGAAVCSAFDQAGFDVDRRGLYVLMNARRYLPAGMTVWGNFAAGQFLAPGNMGNPRDFDAVIKAAADVGRPLTSMAAGAAKTLLDRDQRTASTVVATESQVHLALSIFGKLPVFDRLPWSDGPATDGGSASDGGPASVGRRLSVAGQPAGPEGITVSIAELAGELQVTASFHSSTFDPDQVARAVDLVCHEPTRVLASVKA